MKKIELLADILATIDSIEDRFLDLDKKGRSELETLNDVINLPKEFDGLSFNEIKNKVSTDYEKLDKQWRIDNL